MLTEAGAGEKASPPAMWGAPVHCGRGSYPAQCRDGPPCSLGVRTKFDDRGRATRTSLPVQGILAATMGRPPPPPPGNHPSRVDHAAVAAALLQAKPVLYDKLRVACDVERGQAEPLLVEVLRFVNLAAHAAEELGWSLTPSETVDRGWHEIILCTREYAALCHDTFGRFVHHDPGGSDELNRSRFRETIRLYNLWFGPPDPRYWGPQPEELASADCGACQTNPAP